MNHFDLKLILIKVRFSPVLVRILIKFRFFVRFLLFYEGIILIIRMVCKLINRYGMQIKV